MAMRRISVEVDVPEELLEGPDGEARVVRRVREGVALDLLRSGTISQGRAAELLGLDRYALVELMNRHDVPYFNLTGADIDEELA
jgi:predicted HTH domain antitoxin